MENQFATNQFATNQFATNQFVKQNNIWEQKAEKLHEIQRLKSHYSKLASNLSKELIELSGGQHSSGQSFIFHSYNRIGSVEYNRIPELKYVDLNKYRKKDITIWKLENIGKKTINLIHSM